MSVTTRKKGQRRKVEGCLDPNCLYTADGLMKAIGIGHATLDIARSSGLKTHKVPFGGGNGRVFYRGCDVIAWIEKQALDRS